MSMKMTGWKAAILLGAAFLIAALAFVPTGCGGGKTQGVTDKTSEGTVRKIDQLIYPTMGYPLIVMPGQEFTFEFDFTLNDSAMSQPQDVGNWRAAVTAGNGPAPYHADLSITNAEEGRSSRWPEDSGRQVYDVTRLRPGCRKKCRRISIDSR
jgi:hypothetical protein